MVFEEEEWEEEFKTRRKL